MKKNYVTPNVERIAFDYTIQTAASSCFGSVMNVKTSEKECGEGTPTYIGWNDPQTGV